LNCCEELNVDANTISKEDYLSDIPLENTLVKSNFEYNTLKTTKLSYYDDISSNPNLLTNSKDSIF